MAVRASGMVHSPRVRGRVTMPRKRYESQRKAERKYQENTQILAIRFNLGKEDEAQLLAYAKEQPNTAEFIRDLIRADMEKRK